MYTIAVIDEDSYRCSVLLASIGSIMKSLGVWHQKILSYGDWASSTSMIFKNTRLDIIFISVSNNLPRAISIAKQIRRMYEDTRVVLYSNIELTIQCLDVSCLHRIMNIEDQEELKEILKQDYHTEHFGRSLYLRAADERYYPVRLSNIIYCEHYYGITKIHTPDNIFTTPRKLSSLSNEFTLPMLDCHKSYVVNLKYVSSIGRYSLLLYDSIEIPISRSRYSLVRQMFQSWILDSSTSLEDN